MTLDEVIAEFKSAATSFAQGNPEPLKPLFSHTDDVTLANPFGPAVRGWDNVSAALDYASSRFSNGKMIDVYTIARFRHRCSARLRARPKWLGGRPMPALRRPWVRPTSLVVAFFGTPDRYARGRFVLFYAFDFDNASKA